MLLLGFPLVLLSLQNSKKQRKKATGAKCEKKIEEVLEVLHNPDSKRKRRFSRGENFWFVSSLLTVFACYLEASQDHYYRGDGVDYMEDYDQYYYEAV